MLCGKQSISQRSVALARTNENLPSDCFFFFLTSNQESARGVWTVCPLMQAACCAKQQLFKHIIHTWSISGSLSSIACCPGLCEAALKYLCLTVRACLPVCFPWCTSPSLAWRRQWKRPLFLSLWGMLHALMTQSGRNYSHYTSGMSLNQSVLCE